MKEPHTTDKINKMFREMVCFCRKKIIRGTPDPISSLPKKYIYINNKKSIRKSKKK